MQFWREQGAFWRFSRSAVVVLCALPGVVFTIVEAASAGRLDRFETPLARNLWETATIFDYFTMVALSPILVPVMWLVWWKPRPLLFEPTARGLPVVTGLALWGTLGALVFWVRFFN
jgi:hypothetical protein